MPAADHGSVLGAFRDLRAPVSVHLPLAIALAVLAWRQGPTPLLLLTAALSGFALWTLMEYWIHRAVLHMIPRGRVRRYLAGRHILHHRNPLGHPGVALLWVSLLVASTVFAALWLSFGRGLAAAIMVGIVTGYLSYEYTHLASHVGFAPLTPWGGWLRRHHSTHHEDSARHNYAIVMPLWDWIFRTRWQPPPPRALSFPEPLRGDESDATPRSDAA